MSDALPSGIRTGQLRNRNNRLIKNARWYLVRRSSISKIGWGDLSYTDLVDIAEHIAGRAAFVVLPERPRGGQHLPFHPPDEPQSGWCWYDRPDDPPGPTTDHLAESASYAILNSTLRYVDRYGDANRVGNVWVRPGYRCTRGGRLISGAPIKVPVVSPEDLLDRLDHLSGDPGLRSRTQFGP